MPESIFTHDDPNARSEDPDIHLGNEPDTSNRLPLPLTSGEVGKRTKTESIQGSRAASMLKRIRKLQDIVDTMASMTSGLIGPFMSGTNLDRGLQARLQILIMEGRASINYLTTMTKTMQEGGTWPLFLLLQGKFDNLVLFIQPMLDKDEGERPKEPVIAGSDMTTVEAFMANDRGSDFKPQEPQPQGVQGKYRTSGHSFQGIDLYIRAPTNMLIPAGILATPDFGPGDIGFYTVTPRTVGTTLLYYVGRSNTRNKDEWIIGPAWVERFTKDQKTYEQKAKQLLSTEGHAPSVLEQEALTGDAPWQDGQVEQGELGTGKRGRGDPMYQSVDEPAEAAEAAEIFHQGMTMASKVSNGTSFTTTYNAAQRLMFYQRNAKKLSERILQDFKDGKITNAEARVGAVNGRNDYLNATRERITPSQRQASRMLKEEGHPVSVIENKIAGDLPAQYAGHENFRKGELGDDLKPKKVAKVRSRLDADSPEWGRLGREIQEAGDAQKAAKAAQASRTARATLMDRPAVTEGVIRSAGRGNSTINLMAKGSLALGVIGATAEIEQLTVEIIDAEKADKLRVASRGLASLGGAMIGGELGAGIALGGLAWTCLLVGASISSPYIIVLVSVVGAFAGAQAGQAASETGFDTLLEAGKSGGGFAPSSMLATKGGFGGLQAATDNERLSKQYTTEDIVETKIREIDQKIEELETEMTQRAGCDINDLQRRRADLVDERAPLEEALTQIRLGLFDFGDDPEEDQPTEPDPEEEQSPNA